MSKSRTVGDVPWHPFLVSCYFVFALYAANPLEVRLADPLLPAAVSLLIAALALLTCRVLTRSWQQAALTASVILVVFYLYSTFYDFAEGISLRAGGHIRHRYALLAFLFGAAIIVLLVRRIRAPQPTINRRGNVLAVILVLTPIPMLIMRSAGDRTSGQPAVADRDISLTRPNPARDIYYLVFDRYGNLDTLANDFGFDNSKHYDELVQRGFVCIPDARANYAKTEISMSSALNMDFHDEHIHSVWYYSEMLQSNRFCRLIKNQGYKFYYFGNWFEPMRSQALADHNHVISPLPTSFADALYRKTPLEHFYPLSAHGEGNPESLKKELQSIKHFASKPGPKFIYAHLLIPHEPYVFNRDGSLLTPQQAKQLRVEDKYINQLIYTNSVMLDLVDHIKEVSEVEPIIVIQADEGPYLRGSDRARPWAMKIRKRTGIISAFHLPESAGRKEISRFGSPVNTFRTVLRTYFGADLALLEDRVFYWKHSKTSGVPDRNMKGNRFIDVTRDVDNKIGVSNSDPH